MQGRIVSDEELATVNLRPNTFQGEWNYTILPCPKRDLCYGTSLLVVGQPFALALCAGVGTLYVASNARWLCELGMKKEREQSAAELNV